MTQQFDQQNIEGIVYDNACKLHWYLLNREPKDVIFKDRNAWKKQTRTLEVEDILAAPGHLSTPVLVLGIDL